MRLVIDSNVYISAMTVEGLSHEVLALSLGEHEVFVTDEILSEVERALRKKFKEPDELVAAKMGFLREKTSLVEITGHLRTRGRDPKDDHVLEAAQVAHADVVITGDKDLLILKRFEATTILTPREFVEAHG